MSRINFKNIVLCLFLIIPLKIAIHFFLFTEVVHSSKYFNDYGRTYYDREVPFSEWEYHHFEYHYNRAFTDDLHIYVFLSVAMIFIMWYFNLYLKKRKNVDENNVDTVRNKVKGFASTVGFKDMNDKIKLISGILIWVIYYFSIHSKYSLTQMSSNSTLLTSEITIMMGVFALLVILPVSFITTKREKKKLPLNWGHYLLIGSIILTFLSIISKIGRDGSLF